MPLLYGPSSREACLPTQSPLPSCTPGPLLLVYRAKVTTRYYQTTMTPLDTRPNLPLLYGPSFGTSPPTRSPVPDCTGTCGRHHGHPPRTPNGQQLKPTCAADLPTCRSSTDQVTARPPQIGNHSTGSVTSPACRSRRTRPPTASSTDTEECWAPIEGSISQAIQSPNRRSSRAPKQATRKRSGQPA